MKMKMKVKEQGKCQIVPAASDYVYHLSKSDGHKIIWPLQHHPRQMFGDLVG